MQRRHLLQLAALGALPSSLSLASTAWAQAKDPIQSGCPVPMSGPSAANANFADPANGFVTGQLLYVCGGASLGSIAL